MDVWAYEVYYWAGASRVFNETFRRWNWDVKLDVVHLAICASRRETRAVIFRGWTRWMLRNDPGMRDMVQISRAGNRELEAASAMQQERNASWMTGTNLN